MALENVMRVDNGKVVGAFTSQAKNVAYGNQSVEDALDGRMLRKKILTIPASTASAITGWYYGYAEYSTSVIPASAFILNAYSSLDAAAVPTMADITARPNNMVRVSGVTAHDNSNVMVTVGWVDDFVSE